MIYVSTEMERTEDSGENDKDTRDEHAEAARVASTTRTRMRLSPHFVIEEFDCKDGTRVPRGYGKCLEYLCHTFLEPMRTEFGACTVHSGYRTKEWNTRVGGAPRSFHRYEIQDRDDCACDVSFHKGSVEEWAHAADEIRQKHRHGKGGLGVYPSLGFIHIDSRDFPANWRG